MRRLPFLPGGRSSRTRPLKRLGAGAILAALIGDLLIWSGIIRRGLSLDGLEAGLAERRRARARRFAGGGAA